LSQGLPQPPQFAGSDVVSTQFEPQSVWVAEQVFPLLPPVLPGLPPVLELPPCELLQAAVRIAKPRPKSHTRALVITTYIPGQTETVAPWCEL
jgi:hypothetical protein